MKKGDLKIFAIIYVILMTFSFLLISQVDKLRNNQIEKHIITMNE